MTTDDSAQRVPKDAALDALITSIRNASNDKALDIGTAWNLLSDADDALVSLRRRVAELEAELTATTRELERWRHDETVAEDFVCPDSARVIEIEAQLAEAQRVVQESLIHEQDATGEAHALRRRVADLEQYQASACEELAQAWARVAELEADRERRIDLMDYGWSILCNVSGGDWRLQSTDWQGAVERYRTQYFELLDAAIAKEKP